MEQSTILELGAEEISKRLNRYLEERVPSPFTSRVGCYFEADSDTEISATISLTDPFFFNTSDFNHGLVLAEDYVQKKFKLSLNLMEKQLISDIKSWRSGISVNLCHEGAYLYLWSDLSFDSIQGDTEIFLGRIIDLIEKAREN